MKGRKLPWLRRIGKNGYRLSEQHRKKLSGPNHWNWKGGVAEGSKKQKREARLRQNGGYHTLGEWQTAKAQYDWRCPSCKKSEPEIKLTKDHIIALSKGGSDNIENIQPLCRPCNSKKNTNEIRFSIT